MVQAISLDMGSSQIKVGILNEQGYIEVQGHEPAPQLKGREGIRIANPQAYLAKATQLLKAATAPKETPLGISSQRSSFVLWHAWTGKTLTPLISWQDLRAHTWCQAHAYMAEEVHVLTGLPLSPHYAAAKLALLFEQNKDLRRHAARGVLKFGTLETYLLWHWTEGTVHHTDISMAARTQLVERHQGKWSERLLELYGIPAGILPNIASESYSYPTSLNYPVQATVADQAACALPIFHGDPNAAFINAGTATFVMRKALEETPPGLLSALLPRAGKQNPFMIWEAPINAGARVLRGFKFPTNAIKSATDDFPNCFGIADVAGLGAPHWRPELAGYLSEQAAQLSFSDRQQIYFEALIFRTKEVLELLFDPPGPNKVILAGGLSARFDYSQTLASLLEVPLFQLKEKEMSLWGAAWLATECASPPKFQMKQIQRRFAESYLTAKYPLWKAWLQETLKGKAP